ncbi:unnamed protein product [Bathycoccus prasinos]
MSAAKSSLVASLLLLFWGCPFFDLPRIDAAIHTYEDSYFFSVNNAFIYRGGREGLFKSSNDDNYNDFSSDWGVKRPAGLANGKSYIRFNKVAFRRSLENVSEEEEEEEENTTTNNNNNNNDDENNNYSGLVQAVVFEVNDRDLVGYVTEDGGRRYCCDEALAKTSGCSPGRVIVRPKKEMQEQIDEETKEKKMVEVENVDWPWVTDAYFEGKNELESRTVDDAVSIEETGMYYLWFVICDPKLAGTTVNGQTAWKNPSGYLPGMMAANLPFYLFLSLAYLALGICWAVNCAVKWKYLMQIHHSMTFVVSLGMIETCVWYYDYSNFNTTGFRPYFVTIFAVVVSAARKAVSRALVLVASMGYGVVRPTLGGFAPKVLALSGAYFIASATLDVVANVGAIDDLTSGARVFLVLPVAALDGAFILWIFTSLSKTLAQLQQRRQMAKLSLYRYFTNALALSVVLSFVWVVYEMWFKVTDAFNEKWEADWITAAFWHVLNFALTVVICFLWRPMEPEKFVGNKSGSVDANDSFWTEEEMSAVDNELAEAAGHHELGGDSDDDEEGGGGGGGGKME